MRFRPCVYVCVIHAQEKPVLLFTFFSLMCSLDFLAGFVLALWPADSVKDDKTLSVSYGFGGLNGIMTVYIGSM